MSADIEKGLVKTVIVKDLSRFGRNYIEVGSYSEIIYPEAGVRFIAIMDNVDTGSLESNEFAALVLMFHLMVASPFPVVATMMSVVLKKQYLGKKKEGNPLLFYSSFLFSF